jgi:hypothetical protein
MSSAKTETVTFRISAEIKATLRQAAEGERRSLTNMLEVMIRDWSAAHQTVGGISSGAERPEGLGQEQAN